MDRLTPREREVLALLAEGHSNAAIADLSVRFSYTDVLKSTQPARLPRASAQQTDFGTSVYEPRSLKSGPPPPHALNSACEY
jgi:hypothetical protein